MIFIKNFLTLYPYECKILFSILSNYIIDIYQMWQDFHNHRIFCTLKKSKDYK